MATLLYLNNTQVYPDGKQQIKIVRENPYFTQSESYTLDVTLPMDILENRDFFQNIQRIERSKNTSAMSCRLVVNNKPLLQGSAKVTQVTEKEVKVQLIGGLSEVKFLSNENQTYIDEMEGPFTYMQGVCMPAYDETYEDQVNKWEGGTQPFIVALNDYLHEAVQPNLVGLMKEVLAQQGFTITENCTDRAPWNCLYIASAKRASHIVHALPHWTVREFVTEYCNFFNCSFITDQVARTVRIVSNGDFFGSARYTGIVPVDEYTVEMSDEESGHSIGSDNIRYDMSGSPEHDYDIIPDNVRDSAPVKEYPSLNEARTAYGRMSDDERKRYIFKTPIGLFVGWEHSMKEETGADETISEFLQIDVFGPLIRDNESENETLLKICPVAISSTILEYHSVNEYFGGGSYPPGKHPWRYISLENPTGNEYNRWGDNVDDPTVPTAETSTIQDYIEGEVSIEKSEKEDRMQVFFVDDVIMSSVSYEGWDNGQSIDALMPFTDFLYKRMYSASHRQWSLSLNPTAAEHYLGQLHQNAYTFDMKAKYCVKFLADEMPDPTQVFIIRNKRFACEKVEALIDEQGLQQLVTGYFYEML